MPPRRRVGPVERSTRADLKSWDVTGGLAESALVLARTLDEGAGLAVAAVARELRATMESLRPVEEDHDDLDRFLAGLSTPIRDAAD
jgi:hypothetical protein